MTGVASYVAKARQDGASDIHLIFGLPPKYRKDGQLENMEDIPLSADDCMDICRELAGKDMDIYEKTGELDAAATFSGVRCRIHIFRQQGMPSVALRLLSDIVTGETGSGKSTSLASMLDFINHTQKCHIVTLEDPVEYIYTPDKAAINQREVGKDTLSFAAGLRASLREDPNVILIGEMRDRETIETAITAAETGHLVFGTLHTGSASDAVDRIVQVFPEGMQMQIRLQLSMCLQAVITQQLVPKKNGGRVLAVEMMVVTDAIRNLIRNGNTPQIANAIATSAAIGGQTMDQALVRLVRGGKITKDVALKYAHETEYVKKNA